MFDVSVAMQYVEQRLALPDWLLVPLIYKAIVLGRRVIGQSMDDSRSPIDLARHK